MKISVITAVLNGAKTVAETLNSVAAQDHDEIEHIVVDGGSTDATLEIVESVGGDRIRLIGGPDDGIYHGMNRGIAAATGDIVGFLNADDFYHSPSVLSEVCAALAEDDVDGCYADLVYVDADDTDRVVRYWTSRPYEKGLFERGWMPAHPTFYVRRSVYEAHGGFDTRLKFQSDFEHTARLMAVGGIRTRYIPRTWVRMRMGGVTNRSVSNIIKGNLESYAACRRLGLKVSPLYFFSKFAMRLPQFFRTPANLKREAAD